MKLDPILIQGISFVFGVLSSLVASWMIVQHRRAPLRLRFRSVMKLIVSLASRIRQSGYVPDHIVAIDRNSGVVGSILSGMLGPRAIISVTLSHARDNNGARKTIIDETSKAALRLLKGERILLLICCNGTGTSLAIVSKYLDSLGADSPRETRTAALYTTSSPLLVPNFYGIIVDDDAKISMNVIVSRLPWMTKEWTHALGTERLHRREAE